MQTVYQLPSLFDLQLELYRDETTLISKYKYAFLSKYTWPEIRDIPYAHAQNKKNMAGEINSELLRIFHEN